MHSLIWLSIATAFVVILDQTTVHCSTPPAQLKRSKLPKPPACGVQTSFRLYGGQLTMTDEYSCTALIEYEKPNGRFGFHCGGSLINEWNVLTAAHCVRSLPEGWKVHRVRLGEWDLNTTHDCDRSTDFCNDPPVDLDIATITVHDEYGVQGGNHMNDIALIRFERKVNFSETIIPVCLPLSDSIPDENALRGTVVGWGKSFTAGGVPQKLRLELNQSRGCTATDDPTRFCVSGMEPKLTCSVDSGGPLIQYHDGYWYLAGIAGHGTDKCGFNVPAIFTNVSAYVRWVEDHIHE